MMDKIEKKFWLSVLKRLKKMISGVKFTVFIYKKTMAIRFERGKDNFILDQFKTGKEYNFTDLIDKVEKCLLD